MPFNKLVEVIEAQQVYHLRENIFTCIHPVNMPLWQALKSKTAEIVETLFSPETLYQQLFQRT